MHGFAPTQKMGLIMQSNFQDQSLLDIGELSAVIGIAPQTIYNRISNAALRATMPPRTYVPGCNRVFFKRANVYVWLSNLQSGWSAEGVSDNASAGTSNRGRGRPRKSEIIAVSSGVEKSSLRPAIASSIAKGVK